MDSILGPMTQSAADAGTRKDTSPGPPKWRPYFLEGTPFHWLFLAVVPLLRPIPTHSLASQPISPEKHSSATRFKLLISIFLQPIGSKGGYRGHYIKTLKSSRDKTDIVPFDIFTHSLKC